MFEFSVCKDMKKIKNNNDKRRILACILALCLTLIVKELKISVEQGRMVTTSNIIKHSISYLFSAVKKYSLGVERRLLSS